ncbi:hypothetical protein STEG23_034470 [Scotinomys teguina]
MVDALVNEAQSCVSLGDVCLYFTEEEWDLLSDAQKLLYRNVMLENFSLVLSLGLPISKSFPGTPAKCKFWVCLRAVHDCSVVSIALRSRYSDVNCTDNIEASVPDVGLL